ncbi:MAG: STAS domain-containing protein [Holophagaceae bacterium]|nr:STAS domain-containing protein [Holophagaceae bacterium]
MTLKRHLHQGILIIAPGEKVTITEGGDELLKAVQQGLEEGVTKVLLDLSTVAFMDSLGVGQIVASYVSIKNKGGQFILCGLKPRIALVLRMASLHLVLDIKDLQPGEILWD